MVDTPEKILMYTYVCPYFSSSRVLRMQWKLMMPDMEPQLLVLGLQRLLVSSMNTWYPEAILPSSRGYRSRDETLIFHSLWAPHERLAIDDYHTGLCMKLLRASSTVVQTALA